MNLLETQINELEKRISAKVENVDLTPLETIVATNTANIATNTTSIETLETEVGNSLKNIETIEVNISTLQNDVSENTDSIASNATGIATLETAVATNEANIATNTTAIAEHETRISALEGGDLPEYYGTSIEEISALEQKVFAKEFFSFDGGTAKVSIGTKGASGPYGIIFTRINPMQNNHFVGELKLFMSNIPSGQTTTTLNLIINGKITALSPTFITGEDYNLLITFDFYASNVSNIFKVQFTDTLLVDTILDYIEITATSGANFAVLNRDYSYRLSSFVRGSGMQFWYSKQLSNVGTFGYGSSFTDIANPPYNYTFATSAGDNLITGIYSYCLYKDSLSNLYYYLPGTKIEVKIFNETQTLKTYQASYNYIKTIKQDVSQIDYSFHNGSMNSTYVICGTTQNQELFLSVSTTSNNSHDLQLNNIVFPSEFVQLNGIHDFWVMEHTTFFHAGYIALHNTGYLIYIPDRLCSYFIVIGKGTQPNAYLQLNRTTINVYYNANGKIVKKQLNYNTLTEKWELSNSTEIIPIATEVLEMKYDATLQKNILIGKVNGTWQLI